MVRLLPLALVVFAACTADDSPHLQLAVGDDGTLHVTLARGPDHTFDAMSATANGIDLGAASITVGSHGVFGSQAASAATASYAITIAQLGTDVAIEVVEGHDRFLLEVPGLGAQRTLQVSNLVVPMFAGEWILLTDGANDRFGGGFAVVQGTQTCSVEWASRRADPAGLELQMSANLARDWWCTPTPAPGSVVSAQLAIDLSPVPIATKCSGPDLACEPIELPAMHVDIDVTVQL
jgi:hypothetical protein